MNEEELMGNTALEKLEYFIDKNTYIKENIDIKAGMFLGILIARIGYNINNYEKATLGYAEKRINDLESLKRFINNVENKLILHEMGKQDIARAFPEKILHLYNKGSFSKNDFIFGMFLGYSLSYKFKKTEEKENNLEVMSNNE